MSVLVEIHLDHVLSEGLVYLHYGGQTSSPKWALWVRAKARKRTECCVSGKPIGPGDEVYRPVGNEDYRGKRILAEVLDLAIKGMIIAGEDVSKTPEAPS